MAQPVTHYSLFIRGISLQFNDDITNFGAHLMLREFINFANNSWQNLLGEKLKIPDHNCTLTGRA